MADVMDRGFVRSGSPDGPLVVQGPDGDPITTTDAGTELRFGGGKTAMTAQVTAMGETTVYTPSAGNAVRILWVSAINDPDQSVSPRIRIGFDGATDYLYSSYAIAHWEEFVGEPDQAVVVDLDQAGDVAFTMHFQEVAP